MQKKYFQVRGVTCDDFLSPSDTPYCDEAGGLILVMPCSLESLKIAELLFSWQATRCPSCLLV